MNYLLKENWPNKLLKFNSIKIFELKQGFRIYLQNKATWIIVGNVNNSIGPPARAARPIGMLVIIWLSSRV